MRIINITLTNFLCYYGENNRLEFTDGLNLVLGANGYGKSKLYDAFQWVFKDGITDEARAGAIKHTTDLNHALVNERALAEAEVGEKIVCEVCIEVSRGEDRVYQLIRRFNVVKRGDDDFQSAHGSHLEVYKQDVLHFKPLSGTEAEEVMGKLIPTDIMPYLWFQGERGVSNLIDTSSRESLKRVVNKMSDIQRWDDFIETTRLAFTVADKEFNQAIGNVKSQQQQTVKLQTLQTTAKSKLEALDEELLAVEKELDKANAKHDNIIGQLTSASKISSLEKDKDAKGIELRRTLERADKLRLGFTKRLFSDSWLLMGTDNLVDKFERKYDDYVELVKERTIAAQVAQKEEEREQTRMPKGIPDRFTVQRMLKEEHCRVCDRSAPKGTEPYKAIEKLLDEPKTSKSLKIAPNISAELLAIYRIGTKMQGVYTNAGEQIKATYEELDELEESRKDLLDQIGFLNDAVATELQNSGLEEGNAGSILISIESTKRDITRNSIQLEKLRSEHDKWASELKDAAASLDKLSEGKIDPRLAKKRKLLEDLHDLAKRMKETQYEKLIKQLESTANQHFARINAPTNAFYGTIKFEQEGNGYIPEIQNSTGRRMDNLNTSQLSSSKLAIIMAIVSANNKRGYSQHYPLIADAPISDFDAVKARAFLAETARTFGQSIIIIKDFLEADPSRAGHYIPDMVKLASVKEDVEAADKKLSVYQLVIPNGHAAQNRKNLATQVISLKV